MGCDVNQAGFVIHSAVHAARPEAQCVLHTHTRAGMTVSTMKCGLLPLTQHAMRFHGRIGYHDYEGPAVDMDERARLAADLGPHDAMILRNHGLLTCGQTIEEAFNAMDWLEMACKVQADAMAANTELSLPTAQTAAGAAHLNDRNVRRPWGILEWPAMIRLLESTDASYGTQVARTSQRCTRLVAFVSAVCGRQAPRARRLNRIYAVGRADA